MHMHQQTPTLITRTYLTAHIDALEARKNRAELSERDRALVVQLVAELQETHTAAAITPLGAKVRCSFEHHL